MADMASSRLSVAPMMDWTDRHYRFLARMMTARTKLYTEMVVAGDLAKKDPHGVGLLLDFSPEEHPIALQLGGNDPEQLRVATDTAFTYNNSNWDEINLNCGCPSERVTNCVFGAALMHDAEVVRRCVSQMERASRGVPVTVKCRLGTDQLQGYDHLTNFVGTVSTGGAVKHFIIHSRECILNGLSPKQNRTVPPLRPSWVHRLQRDFPDLTFSVNGGIKSLEMAKRHLAPLPGCDSVDGSRDGGGYHAYGSYHGLSEVDTNGNELAEEFEWGDLPPIGGVMIGREAYQRCWMLSTADTDIFGAKRNPDLTRREILERYISYGQGMAAQYEAAHGLREGPGYSRRNFMKPIFGLFAKERCGREWRRSIDREWIGKGRVGHREPELREWIEAAMQDVPDAMLDARPGAFFIPDDKIDGWDR
jgi:tRNA-dihydrouridine synthase A